MEKFKLYDDQIIFTNKIVRKIADGIRTLCCQLPTGGGKTVIFSDLANRYYKKYGKSVLIFVHREELLKQTRATLWNKFGIESIPIVAGMKYVPPSPVYVGMVESAFKRLHKLQEIGLVIIDEAHIGSFNKLHPEFKDEIILGFTATPISASKKKPLKLYYEDIVCGPSISELISKGRLCQNVTYAPRDIVNRAELDMKGDEFDENFMAKKYSKVKYIHNTINAYEKWCKGNKTVIFNCNIAHNEIVNAAFVQAGYNAKALDSKTPHEVRVKIMEWFRTTPDAILNNVAIATTGFDEPGVEGIIVNKATQSPSLWIQMTGRGSRVTEYKSMFTIIDMGGNAVTHGDWCQDRNWEDLFWNPPKPGKGGVPPYKECIACEAVIYAGALKCPICGVVQPRSQQQTEILMQDFVMITKNIDVVRLAEIHSSKKRYYPFFALAFELAAHAAKTTGGVTDEIAIFTLGHFVKLAKQWAKNQKIRWSAWHNDKAKEILFTELKRLSPEWDDSKLTSNVNDHHNQPI